MSNSQKTDRYDKPISRINIWISENMNNEIVELVRESDQWKSMTDFVRDAISHFVKKNKKKRN